MVIMITMATLKTLTKDMLTAEKGIQFQIKRVKKSKILFLWKDETQYMWETWSKLITTFC